MALPASGPISMNDMNTDRGIASGTQIDLAAAGTAYFISYNTSGTNDLRFSEFYGASATTTTASPPVYTSYTTSTTTGAEAGCYTGDFYTDFTVTLLDQYGAPINATSNQDFTITYDYNDVQDVGGGYYPGSTIILTVTTGNSSGTLRFYTKQYVNCNYSSLCDGSCYNESTGMTASPATTTTSTTTTTAATTSTTTTTAAPVWYSLYSCVDGTTQNSTQKAAGTFAVNERVTFGGAYWYVLAELGSNPGGPLIDVVTVGGSGVTGCPTTTTSTTTSTTTTSLAPIYPHTLNNGPAGDSSSACSAYASFNRYTYYSYSSSIGSGTTLYTSNAMSTTVSDGYYADATTVWYFSGGSTGTNGNPC